MRYIKTMVVSVLKVAPKREGRLRARKVPNEFILSSLIKLKPVFNSMFLTNDFSAAINSDECRMVKFIFEESMLITVPIGTSIIRKEAIISKVADQDAFHF